MVLVGIVLAVGGFVTTLGAATDVDGVVPVDGAPHQVTLDGSRDRLLMHPEGSPAPDCAVRDDDGAELALEPPSGRVTYGDAGGSWVGWAVVAPTGASLELTCTGAEGLEVRVSPDPGGPGPIVGGVLSTVGGIGLALLGVVVLALVAVLYATGAPRSTTRDGDASTDRSASGSAG
ncbi:hypothetical protein GCM10009737_28090 [Nocardioides lentus]|uniref:Uncharacterized protein n=2 Tax=Nocardioides lentus TaxID=338077 RepID=A0ABP5B021_9ACTN